MRLGMRERSSLRADLARTVRSGNESAMFSMFSAAVWTCVVMQVQSRSYEDYVLQLVADTSKQKVPSLPWSWDLTSQPQRGGSQTCPPHRPQGELSAAIVWQVWKLWWL
jgi:hypothetical protein